MKKYTDEQLRYLLKELLSYPDELPWLEMKHGNEAPEEIGKYISALSNSACVENREFGYMLWGIEDKTHKIQGTTFRPDHKKDNKQPLHIFLKANLNPDVSFDFYSFEADEKKIVLLEIEAAYRQPIMFRDTAYIRIWESRTELRKHPTLEAKIYRTVGKDWSAETVLGATLDDLDSEALKVAREKYQEKHQHDSFAEEIPHWSDEVFLNKAKLTLDGKITHTALILLGKPESAHWLNPSVAKITWHLRDKDGLSVDYQHFDPPLLLAVDKVFAKIRNITLRVMPDGTLFPAEITQYDKWVFREALHNCIAHQDYWQCSSIVVTEYPDRIQFANAGPFAPVTVECALFDNGRPRFYLNRQLTEAMAELKMIDTIGSGMQRMFKIQQKRFMPMPDYSFEPDPETVRMVLYGKILNDRYTQILMREPDLSLSEIVLLDKVQKGVAISKDSADLLRKKKLIEGRYPHIYPAAEIAVKTDNVEEYVDHKAFDDAFYIQQVLYYLCIKGAASRNKIRKLLKDKLSTTLTDDQKESKIGNLLAVTMKRKGLIESVGNGWNAVWRLTEVGVETCRKNNPSCKRQCHKRSLSGV